LTVCRSEHNPIDSIWNTEKVAVLKAECRPSYSYYGTWSKITKYKAPGGCADTILNSRYNVTDTYDIEKVFSVSTMCASQTCHRELEGEVGLTITVGMAPPTTSGGSTSSDGSGVDTGNTATSSNSNSGVIWSNSAIESCVLLSLLSACILLLINLKRFILTGSIVNNISLKLRCFIINL
jgi:hypothetical protein